MNTAAGLMIAFVLIALGGIGLAVFAITHREHDDEPQMESRGNS